MDQVRAVRERLERAEGLLAILDAACAAFEGMLTALRACQDRLDSAFAAYMVAAASAAEGRFAAISAPSLPRSAPAGDAATSVAEGGLPTELAAADLAEVARMLATRLRQTGVVAVDPADRAACVLAAGHAQAIYARLGSSARG